MLHNPGGPLHAIGDLHAISRTQRPDAGLNGPAPDLFRQSLDVALRPAYRPATHAGSEGSRSEYAEYAGYAESSRVAADGVAKARAEERRSAQHHEEAERSDRTARDSADRTASAQRAEGEERDGRRAEHASNKADTGDEDTDTDSVAESEAVVVDARRLLAALAADAESAVDTEDSEAASAHNSRADIAGADVSKTALPTDLGELVAALADRSEAAAEGDESETGAANRVANNRSGGSTAQRSAEQFRKAAADETVRVPLRDGASRGAVEALAGSSGEPAAREEEGIDGRAARVLRELLARGAGGGEEAEDESGAEGNGGEGGRDARSEARAAERSSRRHGPSIEVRYAPPGTDRAQVHTEAGDARAVRTEGDLFGTARGAHADVTRSLSGEQTAATLSRALREQANPEIVRQARLFVRGESSGDIRLVLKPEQLGRVRINLHLEDNRIAGRIIVENSSVKEAFQENLQALQRSLQESGIEAGALEVSVGENNSGSQERDNGFATPRAVASDFDGTMPRYDEWYDEVGLVNVYA